MSDSEKNEPVTQNSETDWPAEILAIADDSKEYPDDLPEAAPSSAPEEKPKTLEDVYVTKPSRGKNRRMIILVGVLAMVFIVIFGVPGVGSKLNRMVFGEKTTAVVCTQVEQGTFVHEITVRGDVSSSSNVSIKCNVANPGGTMLLEVIPEGTYVKKGDQLVVLDSKAFDDQINTQEIAVNNSLVSFQSAERSLETSEIAKKEYLEGSYEVTKAEYENSITSANEERNRLEEYLEHSKKLFDKGFSTKAQLRADEFALEAAEIKLTIAEKKLRVLEEYTKQRQLIQYDSDIETAKANVKAKKRAHELEQEKMKDLCERKENCTILSPQDGQVIYANETGGQAGNEFIVQEGVMVRERQTILLLPDPSRLQVTADVNEGRINNVKVNMPVTLRLDALPGEIITGIVTKVNEFPQPTNMWMGNVKEYRITIKLDPREGLRPGMTADTRILVDKQDNVLMIPTHCVVEHGGDYYAFTCVNGVWDKRKLELGATNGKAVVVISGLKAEDSVVSGAAQYKDKVNLPALPSGMTTSVLNPSSPDQLDKATGEAKDLGVRVQEDEAKRRAEQALRPGREGGGLPEGFDINNLTPEQRARLQEMRNAAGNMGTSGGDGGGRSRGDGGGSSGRGGSGNRSGGGF